MIYIVSAPGSSPGGGQQWQAVDVVQHHIHNMEGVYQKDLEDGVCTECLHEMKIISFITETPQIKKILKYLYLWEEESVRDPPLSSGIPDEIVYVPIEDPAWDGQEYPVFVG